MTETWRRVRNRLNIWRNMLWFRISLFFVLGITIPLFIFAAITLLISRNALYETTNRFSQELVFSISQNIQREVDLMQILSINIAYDDSVQHLSRHYLELSHSQRQVELIRARMNIANILAFFRAFTDVILYPVDGVSVILYGGIDTPFRLAGEHELRMVSEAIEQNGRLVLFAFGPEHQIPGLRLQRDISRGTAECIMFARAIRSLPDGDIIGVLALRLNARFFNDALYNLELGEGVRFFSYDTRGDIVLSTDEHLFTTGMPLSSELSQQLIGSNETVFYMHYGGVDFIAYKQHISSIGWTSVLLVPSRNIESGLQFIVLAFVIILLIVLVLCAIIIQIFNRLFNKPVIRLVSAMNAADRGNLHVEIESVSSDEIGQATRSFNNMLQSIRQLLESVKSEETAKRFAELAALQAQINPHFLSNTLGTARLLAQNQKAENIDQLLSALIDLLRVSMDVSDKTIPLRDEIKYVQSYINIMQYRSYTEIDVHYNIQREAEDCLVPKLILQPLIENALTHGVAGKGVFGQIELRAVIVENDLYLSVTDNGVGISPEKIHSIMNASPSDPQNTFSGIGLPNVHERIRLHYGEKYGLAINSVLGVFTTIEISLPITKEEKGDTCER